MTTVQYSRLVYNISLLATPALMANRIQQLSTTFLRTVLQEKTLPLVMAAIVEAVARKVQR